ncbi:hypothetical protein [Streptomyces sp. NPDC003032]
MRPDSYYLQNQLDNPQSDQQTDWTLIGTDFDVVVVPGRRAVQMDAAHKVMFDSSEQINHQTLRSRADDRTFDLRYQSFGEPWVETGGASPVRVGSNAWYWHADW